MTLETEVQSLRQVPMFRDIDPEVAAQTLWMSVHGLVALLVAKKAFPFAPRAVLIEEQLETLVRGLLNAQARTCPTIPQAR